MTEEKDTPRTLSCPFSAIEEAEAYANYLRASGFVRVRVFAEPRKNNYTVYWREVSKHETH